MLVNIPYMEHMGSNLANHDASPCIFTETTPSPAAIDMAPGVVGDLPSDVLALANGAAGNGGRYAKCHEDHEVLYLGAGIRLFPPNILGI